MSLRNRPRRHVAPARQKGQAFILSLVLIVVGVGAVVFNFATPAKFTIERDKKTMDALAQAKDALIGFAAKHQTRPGALPCPDTNNNGTSEGFSSNECPSYIGRLPWRSLGLPDIRDGSGERLWYALSPNFRNLNPPTGPILNSDTAAQLGIDGGAGNGIAIIFAPGPVVGAQDRNASDPIKLNNPANYLDGGNENGGTSPYNTFTTGTATNDRLFIITRDNFLPAVEQRVARELKQLLLNYYGPPANNSYYPYAAPFPGGACTMGTYRGYMPTTNCPPLVALTFPPWFAANNWNSYMVYAVAPRCTPKLNSSGGSWMLTSSVNPTNCPWPTATFFGWTYCASYTVDASKLNCSNTAAGSYLTVTGVGNTVEALVLSAGRTLAGQSRPCTTAANCLEDAENTDGPGYPLLTDGVNNHVYVKPQKSATNNDQLVVVP